MKGKKNPLFMLILARSIEKGERYMPFYDFSLCKQCANDDFAHKQKSYFLSGYAGKQER